MKKIDHPLIVGIAGGIASGKSTVRRMFEDLGVACIDVDIIARSIHQDATHPVCRELVRQFPDWVDTQGCLLRGSLRQFFSLDPSANRALIKLLKPYVLKSLWKWTANQSGPYVMWESALLAKEGLLDCVPSTHCYSDFSRRLLCVTSGRPQQIERLKKRQPDWSTEEVMRVIAMQSDESSFNAVADDILHNNSDLLSLRIDVQKLHLVYGKLGGLS